MISVHALSMIYELRALRSRLQDMLQELHDTRTLRELEWMLSLTDQQISKIERTGEYIAALEREVAAAEGPAPEADLGEGHERAGGDRHRRRVRDSNERAYQGEPPHRLRDRVWGEPDRSHYPQDPGDHGGPAA